MFFDLLFGPRASEIYVRVVSIIWFAAEQMCLLGP